MDPAFVRLAHVVNLVVPLVFLMAATYLALHILFARLVTNPASPVLWFFGVVTGPLTRPVRALLPAGTAETRVRAVALLIYVCLWGASRAALAALLGPGPR